MVLAFASFRTHAEVLIGNITAQPEAIALVIWGDGLHDFAENWSVHQANHSGWVYGYAGGSHGVFNAGQISPTTVLDAASFAYTTDPIMFTEGDSVFFRGTSGYYGAWKILDVYPSEEVRTPYAYLNVTSYFQTDGSGNFTSVPEPSALVLLLGGVSMLAFKKRFKGGAWSPARWPTNPPF